MTSLIPLMDGSLVFLPKQVSFLALIILFVAGIAEFRQGYIGRVAIAGNAFLLWQIFFPYWTLLPQWFQGYLDLGSIAGTIAIVSYLARESLPTEFYELSYLLYGSLSILAALGLSYVLGVPLLSG